MPQKKLQTKLKTSYKKKQIKPIQAYIMTNMYPGVYNKALDEMKKIKFIEKISIVTGEYDVVVKVNEISSSWGYGLEGIRTLGQPVSPTVHSETDVRAGCST